MWDINLSELKPSSNLEIGIIKIVAKSMSLLFPGTFPFQHNQLKFLKLRIHDREKRLRHPASRRQVNQFVRQERSLPHSQLVTSEDNAERVSRSKIVSCFLSWFFSCKSIVVTASTTGRKDTNMENSARYAV